MQGREHVTSSYCSMCCLGHLSLSPSVRWPSHRTSAVQEFVAIAGAEAQRQAEPDPEKRKYPGGAFDPLGLSKDSKVRCSSPNCRVPSWLLYTFAPSLGAASQQCHATC